MHYSKIAGFIFATDKDDSGSIVVIARRATNRPIPASSKKPTTRFYSSIGVSAYCANNLFALI